ncbi:MAG: hypothetical protein R3B09_11015 [Nannocystaceae bacterium]
MFGRSATPPRRSARPRGLSGRGPALAPLLALLLPPSLACVVEPEATTSASETASTGEGSGSGSGGGDPTTAAATSMHSTSSMGQDLGDMSSETGTTEGPECVDPPPPCEGCVCVDGAWSCRCPEYGPEAGFVTVDAVDYELGAGDDALPFSASPARLFYAFRPAEGAPLTRPLVVLFNGGPSVSTGLLLGGNTGPWTIAGGLLGGEAIAENPSSWASIGNLLYIDARDAGFSYGLVADPSDFEARSLEFRARNFNPYVDAADFVRVLLAFWDAHPALRGAPVIVVAESYGGIRAGILLDMMLEYEAYDGGDRPYRDPALVEAIEAHLAQVFGPRDAYPAALVAQQFGRQVLIQPSVAGASQKSAAGALFEGPSSPMEALAIELGVDFVPCAEKGIGCVPYDNGLAFVKSHDRSIYDLDAPESWLSELFDYTAESLSEPATLELLLGVAPATIEGLAGRSRGDEGLAPFRIAADAPLTDEALGTLGALLGPIAPWDRYYMVYSHEANLLFRSGTLLSLDVDADDPHHGRTFLRNLVHVETFMTRAEKDVAIYAPAYADALAAYPSIVDVAEVDEAAPLAAERPGELVVRYVDAPFPGVGDGEVRRIRAPFYAGASHSVALDAPAELLSDVVLWLEE